MLEKKWQVARAYNFPIRSTSAKPYIISFKKKTIHYLHSKFSNYSEVTSYLKINKPGELL